MTRRRAPGFFEDFRPEISKIPAAALMVALLPGAAFACALPPSVILTLPTGHYITAAAVVVGLTALMGATAHRLPELSARVLWERPVLLPEAVTSFLGFLVFLGLLFIGWAGARDPMHNLMTLVFWTGVWIAIPLGSLLLGNIWRPLNPWTGPVRIARLLLGRKGDVGLARAGHLPAILGYAGFAWFQMVSLYPDDPAVLATVAAGYYATILVLAVLDGEDFLSRGELEKTFEGARNLAEDAISFEAALARYRNIHCAIECSADLAPILVDRVQIQQVILNLVKNAVQSIGKNGTVRIAIAPERNMVRFTVTDTGPGVPAGRIARLFDPFSTTKTEGMGLGLPICRSIIEAHGGSIWYETAPGGGADFIFTVPLFHEEIDDAE